MPRKKISQTDPAKIAEPEIQTKEVEAVHTVKYKEPVRVPVREFETEIVEDEGDDEDLDLEEIEFEEEKPRRKAPQATFRSKIKQKFIERGIGSTELISLRIDELPNYKIDGISGINAEKIFRDALKVTEEYFDGDTYLTNILRKYGPGDYWLTARVKNSIVHNWLERIGTPTTGPDGIARTGVGDDSAYSPTPYVIQQPAPAPQKSLKEQLSEAVELLTLVRRLDGNSGQPAQNPPPAPQISEDVQLASMLLKDPHIKEKAVKSLLGTAGKETDLTMTLIENGPALLEGFGKMLQVVIKEAVAGIDHIKGRQNGQAPAGIPPHAASIQASISPTSQTQASAQNPYQQNGTPQAGGMAQALPGVQPEGEHVRGSDHETAYQETVINIVEHLKNNAPAEEAIKELEAFLWRFPQYNESMEQQIGSDPDIILAGIATMPGGAEIAALPHAKEWLINLQSKFFGEGGEDEKE